ncbi:hypothetical protein GCM10011320_55690 [Neoroseomonas lacus]|uniref:Uncharacterized protein n=1 Tax=Neoroseomonas lacus TaxID=287609 RepID=A0A917NYI7_9PROT|nr:hypothetical protein GCM10011320_55690 [Neoroseomonas lacus]
MLKVGPGKIRIAQRGARQVGADEVSRDEARLDGIRLDQLRPCECGALEGRIAQHGTGEVRAGQFALFQQAASPHHLGGGWVGAAGDGRPGKEQDQPRDKGG